IKDVVSYLRARHNHQDALAWVRLLRLWPGVGAQTAERVAHVMAGLDAKSPVLDARPASAVLLREQAKLARGRGKTALERLASLWELLEDPEQANPGDMIRRVVSEHYSAYAERNFPNATTRKDDLTHLAGYAERFPDACAFLSELSLLQGLTAENVSGAEHPDDKLVLSTIHQAKGLEWPITFVLWLADGRFPMRQSLKKPDDIEEERRLFYVACTRAADELYLCYPVIEETRDGPSHLLRPSRFLKEVDAAPAVFERWEIDEQPEQAS
ncbi:MAG: 3'-5' exonuclease, partial [Nannocystaceae bacterium]